MGRDLLKAYREPPHRSRNQLSSLERVRFTIDRRLPYIEQLATQIAMLIHLGVLAPRERLPKVDTWATAIKVSMRIAGGTYRLLQDWGIVISSNRGGTHVAPGAVEAARRLLYGLRLRELNSWADSIGATADERRAAFDQIAAEEERTGDQPASDEQAAEPKPNGDADEMP